MEQVEAYSDSDTILRQGQFIATCPIKTPNLIVQKSFLKDKALTLCAIE